MTLHRVIQLKTKSKIMPSKRWAANNLFTENKQKWTVWIQ